jgi:hypothetical protein
MSEAYGELDLTPMSQKYILQLATEGIQKKIAMAWEDRGKLSGIQDVNAYNAASAILDAKLRRLEGQKQVLITAYHDEEKKAKDTQGTWLNKD